MSDKKSLILKTSDGEKEYEILYTFKSNNTNKDYIVFTDNTYEGEELNIYSAIYNPLDDSVFEEVTDENDFNEIESFLKEVNGNDNE